MYSERKDYRYVKNKMYKQTKIYLEIIEAYMHDASIVHVDPE